MVTRTTNFYVVGFDRSKRVELMGWVVARGWEGQPFQTGCDFIEELPFLSPGIVLLDLEGVATNGFDLIEAVAGACHACPVIAVLTEPDIHVAVACLKRGAVDVLVWPIDLGPLHEAVAGAGRMLEARQSLSEQIEQDGAKLCRLNIRERQVLDAMALGVTSKAIAQRLCLSVRTVEGHRASVVDKLETGNAAGAIALVVRHETAVLTRDSCRAAIGS